MSVHHLKVLHSGDAVGLCKSYGGRVDLNLKKKAGATAI
jgi:hypothetical protein